MKSLIKKIRNIVFVNILIRSIISLLIKIGFRIDTTHFPVSGVVSINLPNKEKLRLFSKGDDFIPSQVYWKGYQGYEYSVIPFYYLSLELNTILDIGANIGYYSLLAAAANNDANIYSYEPVSRIADRFRKQVSINGFGNIKIEELIVGNANEVVSFYVPSGNAMSLAASTKKGWVKDVDEVKISSTTLDKYKELNQVSKIDLIKMDCEFHEYEVLQGMSGILKSDKPIILMEVLFPESKEVKDYYESNQHIEIEKIMKLNGYYFYLITKDGLVRVESLEYNKIDRNYLFSTKKSMNIKFEYTEISNELL